ncbi:hypothetical protein SERLA73DRAFT_184466 [Serpula lacrymans var. lacrymans S7.3]|uniref:Uncharacterized protein n=2 Tax=Serpula lacrymans var. lacrymans TaxID=341189 RepID=F8Q3A7_SERL3|nr:uncharacterized protein SERLADRAFT_472161 [Serpula lacrymans var. lacrymans S7.9]EGN97668.1 hypothetical protein SERLA73DRAFT_184466 [Serpula lacrymans var. lacrymans S7.3]EGO23261.1 hypothetical protein SERLADRAFT_472161 [Serpula lacrymans var. lacrymans S7.9]
MSTPRKGAKTASPPTGGAKSGPTAKNTPPVQSKGASPAVPASVEAPAGKAKAPKAPKKK